MAPARPPDAGMGPSHGEDSNGVETEKAVRSPPREWHPEDFGHGQRPRLTLAAFTSATLAGFLLDPLNQLRLLAFNGCLLILVFCALPVFLRSPVFLHPICVAPYALCATELRWRLANPSPSPAEDMVFIGWPALLCVASAVDATIVMTRRSETKHGELSTSHAWAVARDMIAMTALLVTLADVALFCLTGGAASAYPPVGASFAASIISVPSGLLCTQYAISR